MSVRSALDADTETGPCEDKQVGHLQKELLVTMHIWPSSKVSANSMLKSAAASGQTRHLGVVAASLRAHDQPDLQHQLCLPQPHFAPSVTFRSSTSQRWHNRTLSALNSPASGGPTLCRTTRPLHRRCLLPQPRCGTRFRTRSRATSRFGAQTGRMRRRPTLRSVVGRGQSRLKPMYARAGGGEGEMGELTSLACVRSLQVHGVPWVSRWWGGLLLCRVPHAAYIGDQAEKVRGRIHVSSNCLA